MTAILLIILLIIIFGGGAATTPMAATARLGWAACSDWWSSSWSSSGLSAHCQARWAPLACEKMRLVGGALRPQDGQAGGKRAGRGADAPSHPNLEQAEASEHV